MIHQYKMGGYNIVMDINSGALHVVDDITYDIIALYEDKPFDEIKTLMREKYPDISDDELDEIRSELKELEESGDLFSKDVYEDYIIDFEKRPTV